MNAPTCPAATCPISGASRSASPFARSATRAAAFSAAVPSSGGDTGPDRV